MATRGDTGEEQKSQVYFTHGSYGRVHCMPHGVTGDMPGCGQVAEDGKEEKTLGQNFYWGFLMADKAGQGNKLGLANLNNFSGL